MNRCMQRVFRIPVFLIFFVLLITAASCSSTGKVNVMPIMQNKTFLMPEEHTVIAAETRTIDRFINVSALVSYDDTEELSFKINNCNLKDVYVKNYEQVEEGQLLAELDATDLEYQVTVRQNDHKRLQLRYDMLESESSKDSDDRKTELEGLKYDMEAIELDIAHIKELISKTQLFAPFSGTIIQVRGFQPGTTIQAYDMFMTIWKTGSIKLLSDILNPTDAESSVDLSGIVTGMKVVLIHGSKDTKIEIPATITKIINTDPGVLDNPKRIPFAPPTFQVTVKPDGIDVDKLKLDSKLILRINTGKLENVVVLPKSLNLGYGKSNIVKVVKGSKIIKRNISTGYEDVEEEIVVITSGLRPGESILLK